MSNYEAFLASKRPRAQAMGIEPAPMPDHLSDFQQVCVAFALRQGRAALFEDTGLGKTRQELEFCRQTEEYTGLPSILFTPLGVTRQIEREGLLLGYECRVVRDQSDVRPGTNITNYDRLDLFDPAAFGTIALDEADILKNFSGKTSMALIAAFADTPFRLCATATPAPNDHVELGTHAEFLGIMSQSEMLIRWFLNDSNDTGTWRLKGHAVEPFWDWMASWAIMIESPADMGFDGSAYVLPPLNVIRHKAEAEARTMDGTLFGMEVSATDIFKVKRHTADARADVVAQIIAVEPDEAWLIWVDTDFEADAVNARVSGVFEVRGSHSVERKETGLLGFSDGSVKRLLTKGRIGGQGMNYQNCARQIFTGRTFSYRDWYQMVRRSWRFGQTRRVDVHLIVAEGEDQIGRIIDRKADAHADMKAAMLAATKRNMGRASMVKVPYLPTHKGRLPTWLQSSAA